MKEINRLEKDIEFQRLCRYFCELVTNYFLHTVLSGFGACNPWHSNEI